MGTKPALGSARALLGAAAFAACAALAAPARAEDDACAPSGDISYLCGLANMEDLVQAPGRALILTASYGIRAGAESFVVIDAAQRSASTLPLSFRARPERSYAACPGALDLDRFSPHGIAIRPGRNNQHTLYVVNHSARESVEVFRLDARGETLSAQWIGCVVLPEGASGNAVVPLADGGFLVTKFFDTTRGPQRPQFLARERNSVIYRWSPRAGFSTLPGSEGVSDNGVEVSPDGRYVYFTSWVEKKITRLPLDGAGETLSAPIDFMPDNIRFDPDGALLIAGQASTIELLAACKRARCPADWGVARVDPETLAVSYLYWEKGTDAFAGATTALQVGEELWLGTFRGDRVAIAPVPAAPLQ